MGVHVGAASGVANSQLQGPFDPELGSQLVWRFPCSLIFSLKQANRCIGDIKLSLGVNVCGHSYM